MDIPGSIPPTPLTLTPLAGLPKWTPGEVLNAVVENILANDRILLRVSGATIEAGASSGAFSLGQSLSLQVVRSEDRILLRVLMPEADGPRPSASSAAAAPASAGTLFTLTGALPAARVGQTLHAVVIARSGDGATLDIDGKPYEARPSQTALLGQRFIVEVIRAERPAVLKVTGASNADEALRSALRAALPRQLPLQQVFARIGEMPAASGGAPAAALKHLLQNLADAEDVTRGDTLKQALQDSGQFLERRLRSEAPPSELRRDLKANLLQLLDVLNRSPEDDDLAHQVEAALARIQLHQLAAAAPDHAPPAWAGEIPLRHGERVDVCRLRIDKDDGNRGADGGQAGWNTWISLDLKSLGPLHARLTLNGQALSSTLWAESDITAALLREHLDHLRQALQGLGLEVKELRCRCGRPPFLPSDRPPAGLLDITV
jgi:hypothetical protein